ncbi:MAG TPA: nucleotidyltransferase domain-containing protein [Candidatus Kapabacteria bacterium]|nr:nucleotidyltransferase domain-containing protein [Candidatus Kapabacteria bacterium]
MPRNETNASNLTKIERPPIDDALIAEITRKIVEAFHPKRVILFGSRARGDYHADSDIDLLVEMESDEKPWERRVKIGSLFLNRWWPMDILVYTPKEIEERRNSLASIIPDILHEGQILYHAA